jgi:hypothetical protein
MLTLLWLDAAGPLVKEGKAVVLNKMEWQAW